jgi:hypothetical protein
MLMRGHRMLMKKHDMLTGPHHMRVQEHDMLTGPHRMRVQKHDMLIGPHRMLTDEHRKTSEVSTCYLPYLIIDQVDCLSTPAGM